MPKDDPDSHARAPMRQVPGLHLAPKGKKGRAARASNEEMLLKDDIFTAQTQGARTSDEVEEEEDVNKTRLLTEALRLKEDKEVRLEEEEEERNETRLLTEALELRLDEEEVVTETRLLAESGDGCAMYNLGLWYELGDKGLAEDKAKAFKWFEKSYEAGDLSGTGCLGRCYLMGKGVPACLTRGVTVMSEAATRGSKSACFILGYAYGGGLNGFPYDENMARRYYSMVASASIDDCLPVSKEEAATWLREHSMP